MTKESLYSKVYNKSCLPYFLLLFGYPPKVSNLIDLNGLDLSIPVVFLDFVPKDKLSIPFIVFRDEGLELQPLPDYIKLLIPNITEPKLQYFSFLYKTNKNLFYTELYRFFYTKKTSLDVNFNVWEFYKQFFGRHDISAIYKLLDNGVGDWFINAICFAFVRSLLKLKSGVFDKSASYKQLLQSFDINNPSFLHRLYKSVNLYSIYKNQKCSYLYWISLIQ